MLLQLSVQLIIRMTFCVYLCVETYRGTCSFVTNANCFAQANAHAFFFFFASQATGDR